MPFYGKSLVFAALGEKVAGVSFANAKNGLAPVLVGSQVRSPVMALLFGLLLGKALNKATPSTPPAPASTGSGSGASGGSGSGSGGTGSGGSGGVHSPQKIPSFRHMSKSEAKAWAHIIGLEADFHDNGPVVISQTPHAGRDMPANNTVELTMGEFNLQAGE
jgi:hypothetical protein